MSFALDIRKFAEKAKERADIVVKSTVTAVIVKTDERSPVGDPDGWQHPAPNGYVGGRFRGNWQLGVGTMPEGMLERIDPSGKTTIQANIAAIPDEAAGKVYYLANNTPYAQRIENGLVDKAVADAKVARP